VKFSLNFIYLLYDRKREREIEFLKEDQLAEDQAHLFSKSKYN
jgi:hypothetical protein